MTLRSARNPLRKPRILFALTLTLVATTLAQPTITFLGQGCCRNSQGKNPKLNTYKTTKKVNNAEGCENLCRANPDCTAFEYAKKKGSKASACEVHTSEITQAAQKKKCPKTVCYGVSAIAVIPGPLPTPVPAPVQTLATPVPTPAPVKQVVTAPVKQVTVTPAPAPTEATKAPAPSCKIFPRTDMSGHNLKTKNGFKAKNYNSCIKSCLARSSCTHFTFINNRCYLKKSGAGKKPHKKAIGGDCTAPPPPPPPKIVITAKPPTQKPTTVGKPTATAAPPKKVTVGVTVAPVTEKVTVKVTAAPITEKVTARVTTAPVTEKVTVGVTAAPNSNDATVAADADGAVRSCSLVLGVALGGKDIGNFKETLVDSCVNVCLSVEDCTQFTLHNSRCFLKSGAPHETNTMNKKKAISGYCTGRSATPIVTTPPPAPYKYVHKDEPVDWNDKSKYTISLEYNNMAGKGRWNRKIFEAQGGSVGGKLYVFGGFVDGYDVMTKDTMAFDPVSREWTKRTPMPGKFNGVTHMANAVDHTTGFIYLLGGIANVKGGQFPEGSIGIPDVFEYDAHNDKWKVLPSLPEGRGGGAAVVLDNKLHFFNGARFDGKRGGFLRDMATHFVFDLGNPYAGWSKLAPNSLGRNHVGGVVWGGKIFALGGQFFEEEGCTNQMLAEVYNPKLNKWKRIADLPIGTGHISPSTFATHEGIVIVGGVTDRNKGCKPPGFARNQLLFYNPRTDKWTDVANQFNGPSQVTGYIDGTIYLQYGGQVKSMQLMFGTSQSRRERGIERAPIAAGSANVNGTTRKVAPFTVYAVIGGICAAVFVTIGTVTFRSRAASSITPPQTMLSL